MLANLELSGMRNLFCQQIYDAFRPLIIRMRIGKSDKATSQEVKACLKSLAVAEDANLGIFWSVVSESCIDTGFTDFKGVKNP